MNKTDARIIAGKLTDSQGWAVRNALYKGEETRVRRNAKSLRAQYCEITYSDRVNATTKRSLASKGLLTHSSVWPHLTSAGVMVAKASMADYLSKEDREDNFGTTVETYVAEVHRRQAEADAESAKEVRHAKKLWAGIKIHTWDGDRSIASQITDGDRQVKITLYLDDLIKIGEQIERRRTIKVGWVEACEPIAEFPETKAGYDKAVELCGMLPDAGQGIYYLDAPERFAGKGA